MAKLLLVPLLALSILIAFFGYNYYAFQAENLRLKTELQSLDESYQTLEAEYTDLQGKYQILSASFNLLNQSYYMLDANYAYLNQSYYTLLQNYTRLSIEYQGVLTNYVNLMITYNSLNETYYSLLQNYAELEQKTSNYTELLSQHQALTQNYQALLQNYTQLKNEYDALFVAFYKPLPSNDKVAPTVDELRQWLAEDKTNEINYTYPDFVCGDYAVMLHLHAKLNRWDVGVVGVLGNLSDGEFNHAFNAIICQEGLRYIEPQNDEIFEATIDNGLQYNHPGFGQVYVREFTIIILYTSE